MKSYQSICVVGAGPSGLCTIKELKECGIHVTCYEKNSTIGGAFAIRTSTSKIYDSLLLTVSNFFMAYSGFPISSQEGRRYWNAVEYEKYLQKYSKKFGLLDNINFNSSVTNVERLDTGYKVTTKDHSGKEITEIFDAVVMCSGTNKIPYIPEIDGADLFEGDILHTDNYTNADQFSDKKVVCIGIGESGADIAHEISNKAKECTLLMRSTPSVVPRWINKNTSDGYTTRSFNALGKLRMNKFMRLKGKLSLAVKRNNSKTETLHYGWLAKSTGYFNHFLTKNDNFIEDIAEGRLMVEKATIKEIGKTSIELSNGSRIDADTLIFSTGYREDFDVVDSFIKVSSFRDLYKHMIHSDLGPTFSFIGWARPSQGGLPACSEMQARYLALVLSGRLPFPDKTKLSEEIKLDREWEDDFFETSKHLTSLVDYHRYMMSMAKDIGCSPRNSLILSPYLSYKLWFGSHLANTYRITGPGALKKQSLRIIKSLPITTSLQRNIIVSLITLFSYLALPIKGRKKIKNRK